MRANHATPQCHNLTHILGSMFRSTTDRVALATAGVLASTSFWKDYLQHANDVAALLGPTMAGIFLFGKIELVGTQIFKGSDLEGMGGRKRQKTIAERGISEGISEA